MSTGTPYIGSKISLISKAEIRYEGFLYTIDQKDSTVTLAKVISLGTEQRCPEKPVPAREEVFEYIVFRGSDIKDLHVCEGPKTDRVDDPAIVHNGPVQQPNQSYGQSSHFHHQGYGPMSGMPPMGYPPYGFQQNGPSVDRQRQTPPSLPRTPTPEPPKVQTRDERPQSQKTNNQRPRNDSYNRDRGSNYSNNSSREHQDRQQHGRQQHDRQQQDRQDNYSNNRNREQYDRQDNRNQNDRRERVDRRPKENNRETREPRDNRHVEHEHDQRGGRRQYDDRRRSDERSSGDSRQSDDRRRGGSRGSGSRGSRGSNSSRGSDRGGRPQNSRTLQTFKEDFDFETANSKFNKEEIEKEILKVLQQCKIKDDDESVDSSNETHQEKEQDDLDPLPSPDKFYDRSKSFFDNISCEAMGAKTEEEKMTRRKERTLNTETFGSAAARYRGSYNGRGRGRGRGGRGRGRGYGGYGGYRGRGNRGGNRNWVDYEFDYEAAGIKKHQAAKAAGGS